MRLPSGGTQAAFLLVTVAVVALVGWQMFYSLTPPRHADHDHAMASLDAGGFLRVQGADGDRRNLVGKPGHVLVLHFFDPAAGNASEQAQAARYAASLPPDAGVEVVFVARADDWDMLRPWAERVGVPLSHLYLDPAGETSNLLGVRRWPETLVYAADGLLAHQAMGPVNWAGPEFQGHVARALQGVSEIH